MLFWWCLIRPWPARRRPNNWGLLFYLIAADVVNTGLSAFLAFCNTPVYAWYVDHPNPLGIQPLPDQALGAAIMWVFGSVAFLIPAGAITYSSSCPPAALVPTSAPPCKQPRSICLNPRFIGIVILSERSESKDPRLLLAEPRSARKWVPHPSRRSLPRRVGNHKPSSTYLPAKNSPCHPLTNPLVVTSVLLTG